MSDPNEEELNELFDELYGNIIDAKETISQINEHLTDYTRGMDLLVSLYERLNTLEGVAHQIRILSPQRRDEPNTGMEGSDDIQDPV